MYNELYPRIHAKEYMKVRSLPERGTGSDSDSALLTIVRIYKLYILRW